jgi:hypothetical protein
MTPDPIAQAIAATLETRALALWQQEKWDRRWMRATWTPARHNRMTELLALLAIRRTARERASSDRLYHELGYHQAQAVPI